MPLKTAGTGWSYTLGAFRLWNNTASSFGIGRRLWSPGASRNNTRIFYELLLGMSWAAVAPGAERGSVARPEERGRGVVVEYRGAVQAAQQSICHSLEVKRRAGWSGASMG